MTRWMWASIIIRDSSGREVVGEAMMALVLARAFLEKFGGDSVDEIRRNYHAYLESLKSW